MRESTPLLSKAASGAYTVVMTSRGMAAACYVHSSNVATGQKRARSAEEQEAKAPQEKRGHRLNEQQPSASPVAGHITQCQEALGENYSGVQAATMNSSMPWSKHA